jgi:hypothetical protein
VAFRVGGRQPFRYAPERPTRGKVGVARNSGVTLASLTPREGDFSSSDSIILDGLFHRKPDALTIYISRCR